MSSPDAPRGTARETGAVSRRLLIGGGIAVVALAAIGGGALSVNDGILPGRRTMYRMLGLDGADGEIPDVAAGPRASGVLVSAHMSGRRCRWEVAYPPGAKTDAALPVLVVLHGYGADQSSSFGHQLGLDRFLAAAVAAGGAPFAIAAVDGGNGYWHPRADGSDSSAMVADELLPVLAARGLRAGATDRIGLLGWSMGGYGALRLAGLLGADRVAVVAAESPAIWPSFALSAHGAFDDASDYARNTVFGRQAQLAGIPARVDCGTGDGFYPYVRDYVAGFVTAQPAGGFESGGHDYGYWRRMAPAQLDFVAKAFAAE